VTPFQIWAMVCFGFGSIMACPWSESAIRWTIWIVIVVISLDYK